MPYKFTFDLSRIPRFFFTEVAKIVYEKGFIKGSVMPYRMLLRGLGFKR